MDEASSLVGIVGQDELLGAETTASTDNFTQGTLGLTNEILILDSCTVLIVNVDDDEAQRLKCYIVCCFVFRCCCLFRVVWCEKDCIEGKTKAFRKLYIGSSIKIFRRRKLGDHKQKIERAKSTYIRNDN